MGGRGDETGMGARGGTEVTMGDWGAGGTGGLRHSRHPHVPVSPHLHPTLDLASVGTPGLGGCGGPKAATLRALEPFG